ncbi:hypothetical protein LXA43DRAFT_1023071 [Ganoderma leucocontextum]|nr:hypothetical protein LXA43DRAFT_1023071 [Ganoderma leucocontextum]
MTNFSVALNVHTQIAYHNAEALRLKCMYNASSLLAKLPPHVLALIFLNHANWFYENHLKWWHGREDCCSIQSPAHKELHEWINVSYVCHRWRTVALDCAPLWTTIVFDERIHPDLLRTILSRSRGLPLNLVLHAARGRHCIGCVPSDGRVEKFGESIDVFREVLPRARELSVFSSLDDDTEVWDALKDLGSANRLEHLCIEGLHYEGFRRQDKLVRLPDDAVAAGWHPSLRTLRISGVRFNWSNVCLGPTLRHLDVSRSVSLNEDMDMDSLLLALSRMSHLETLKLDSLPPLPSPDNNPAQQEYPRTALPRLRKLRLRMKDEGIADFLSRLELPRTASVHFFAESSDLPRNVDERANIPEATIEGLVRASVDLLQGVFPSAIDHRGRTSDWWERRRTLPHTAIWAAESSALTNSPLLPMQPWKTICATPYRLKFAAHLDDSLMIAVLAAIDIRYLRTAAIWDTGMSNGRALVESLRRAENLTTLRLQRHVSFGAGAFIAGWRRPPGAAEAEGAVAPADGVVTAAHQPLPDRWGLGRHFATVDVDAREPPRPLFPRLHTLEFAEVDLPLSIPTMRYKFDKEIGYWFDPLPRNYSRDMEYGLDVPGLVESLRGRRAQGAAAVARVVFDKCQCYERERLVPLVGVVDEVWWDGKEMTVEDLKGCETLAAGE